MNIFNSLLAQAAPAGQGGLFSGPLGMTIMLVGMIAIFYFLIILPQNKRKKQMENMIKSMDKGDKVVTIGGIHGKVASKKDNEITLKVNANTEITFEVSAIARVIKDAPAAKEVKKK
jgi:preprotein translocase subunit YajC